MIQSLRADGGHRETVRLGVVGGGLITQLAHLPALAALERALRRRAARRPEPARARAARPAATASPAAYADHEDLLAHAGVDAVLVCSPNGTHAQVVLDALDAGLARPRREAAVPDGRPTPGGSSSSRARAGRVVQVGYMKRFDPAYAALLERLPAAADAAARRHRDDRSGHRRALRPPGFVAATDVARGTRRRARAGDRRSRSPRPSARTTRATSGRSRTRSSARSCTTSTSCSACSATSASSRAACSTPPAPSDGSLAYGACARRRGARWTAAWMLLPGAASFREELRLFASDGVRALTFAAPYGPAPARFDARSSAPAPTATRAQLAHFHACVTTGAPCRTPAAQGARDVGAAHRALPARRSRA